jgi:tripartite-type tricarboxylate transporter receptor subunit TctC
VAADHPSLPATNIREVIERAKTTILRYRSAGSGNGQHLAGELLAQQAGITLDYIPYKGGRPELTAVPAAEVQFHFPV